MSDQLSSDLASLRIDRHAPREGKGRWFIVTLAVASVAALAVVGTFVVYPYASARMFKTEVQTTAIALVSPASGQIDLTSSGYVVAQTTSKVSATVLGRLARVAVKEGDTVEAGQILAVLEQAEAKSRLLAARTKVLASQARAQTSRANLAEGKEQAERERALVERGVSPKAGLDDLTLRVRSLEEQVKAADAETRAAEAEVEAANVLYDATEIYSPLHGTVVAKPAAMGELVGPVTGPVVELADFRTLVVETDIPEGRLARVKPDSPCEISLDAYPGKRFRGVTVEISKRVNRAKATVAVKVKFKDSADGVLPDMAARVSFLATELDEQAMKAAPKLIVPASAVATRNGAKVVFVVDDDHVREVPVTLALPFGDGFELVQGPSAGTKIVDHPPPTLADGLKIKEKIQ
jgi:RND family efflux transporter MFP subunit